MAASGQGSAATPPPGAILCSRAVRGARALLEKEPSLTRDELAELISTTPGALGRAFRRELGATLVSIATACVCSGRNEYAATTATGMSGRRT